MPKVAAMKFAEMKAVLRRIEATSVKPDADGRFYVEVHPKQMKLARALHRRGVIQLVNLTPEMRKHLL